MFRKPKKNIRLRNIDDDEDDDSKKETVPHADNIGNGTTTKPQKKISKPPALLSFADEEAKFLRKAAKKAVKTQPSLSFADDEEESGEVFQVKKSSYSKKLSRERRHKRDKATVDEEREEKTFKITDNTKDDDLVIVVKKEEEKLARERQQQNIILNGRAALMVGKDDASSSEEDDVASRFKFSQPNRAEITIESGKIPDAATIHAARKQRQRARQMNVDVIPLETTAAPKPEKKGTSRLVREEDEDGSDDERLNMGTGVESNDMSTRRANYYNTIDTQEQIVESEVQSWSMVNPMSALFPPPLPPSLTVTKDLTLASYLTLRLRDRLSKLKEVYNSHVADVTRGEKELNENADATVNLETSAPDLASKFRFYQEMRGYVTDLVECLDEKVPGLVKLEENVEKLWTDRAAYFSGRRRLDVRDQADEMAHQKSGSMPKWSREEEEARARRAAEREGRRTRRRRARELRSIPITHIDGMSSDDEETEFENTTFFNNLEEVSRLGFGLLENVEDEFGTVNGVASRMEQWRDYDITAYTEAYVSLCVPKLLGPIIRFHILTWNPLMPDATELDNMKWWNRLQLFGLNEEETMSSLAEDPDLLLIPTVLEKAVLPKVTKLVTNYWDPMSCSQTQRLVNFLKKYIADMPGMTRESPQIKTLLEAVLAKLKYAVDNDVFIPISFTGGEPKGSSSAFFQRQFAGAVKLLRNMLTFQGLLGAEYIQEVALDSLLNRYLLAALRTCQPCDAITKANIIVSTFPRWWFQTETKIPKLEMLTRHLQQLSTQVQSYDTTEKEAHELVHSLLRTLRLSCPNVA